MFILNLIKKGVGYTVIASMLLTGTALPLNKVAASEVDNKPDINNVYTQQSEVTTVLTDQEIQLLDPYVTFDSVNQVYDISAEASIELNAELYNKLVNQIQLTNIQMQQLSLDEQVGNLQPADGVTLYAAKKYVNGINKVDYHWWGATVYISRNTLIAAGAGVSIGGLWIPEPIISKALGSLGIALGATASITGGIKFDFRWVGITPVTAWMAVRNVSFQ